jgi:membrane protein required for colicin V production
MLLLDIILAGLLAYGFLRGLWNGFFLELASFIALMAGVFLAVKFSSMAATMLSRWVDWNPYTIRAAAFLILFLIVVIGISLLAKFFTTLANFAGIGILNKILGGFFGLMKIALMAGVMLTLMSRYNLPSAKSREDSLFYKPIEGAGSKLYPSISQWMPKEDKD